MNHEKQSIEQILNRNYGRTHLSEGEEWYVSNGRFLTLSQTKKHLFRKMNFIRKALKKAHLARAVAYKEWNHTECGCKRKCQTFCVRHHRMPLRGSQTIDSFKK